MVPYKCFFTTSGSGWGNNILKNSSKNFLRPEGYNTPGWPCAILLLKQNRESIEGYSRRKVEKRHGKFGKQCSQQYEQKQVPKTVDGTRCPEG